VSHEGCRDLSVVGKSTRVLFAKDRSGYSDDLQFPGRRSDYTGFQSAASRFLSIRIGCRRDGHWHIFV